MYVIGITGGIGSGKTRAAQILKEETGAELLISDELGHRVMEPGEPCYDKVLKLFGAEILDTDGSLNRNEIARQIFSDPKKKKEMESIIHPAVLEYISRFINERKNINGLIVLESAILFESGADRECDEVWYIDADYSVRRERLKSSRGYSDSKITAIFTRQAEYGEYKKRCTRVIKNNADASALKESLKMAVRDRGALLHKS